MWLRRLVGRAVAAAMLGLAAGCSSPTAVLDAATSFAEDRSMAQLRDDAAIKIDLQGQLLADAYRDLFLEVSTNVYEGRVMLTGTVNSLADKRRATELARAVEGVKEVYNDLQVTKAGGVEAAASDLWIETKLKARLVAEGDVHSINYRWRSVNGVVYFIGTARSRAELVRVIQVARDTKGVGKVVTHVRLR